jgi:8-oxo-dGTP diphosphatase
MTIQGQNIQNNRYSLIPRTLSFLVREDSVLLIRLAEGHGSWAGRLNGVGGHIEKGEDPYASAKREIREETGLEPLGLKLCGVVIVDTGTQPGIGLYVFVGNAEAQNPRPSSEGEPVWTPIDELESQPLVEDLPLLLPRALNSFISGEPFSALYEYDEDGQLMVKISP